MSKSREELVNAALEELGVLAAGQAAAAEDYAVVDGYVGPTLSMLAARSIYGYGDADNIEEDAFIPLAKLLAYNCATKFGRSFDRSVRIEAENLLREVGAETLSYQPARADYF